MSVAIDVLGPLRLRVADVERPVAGRRQQLLLALLATSPGGYVSEQRLIDDLWGEDPPAAATSLLQVAVSRLRRILAGDAEVRRSPAGYGLHGAEIDAKAFSASADQLVGQAPDDILDTTTRALSMWRGSPYAGLCSAATLAAEATRLEEARLTHVEARAQALLDLGRPEEAHRSLAGLVTDHPFRERLWSLLSLALYRCDRQADALEALRTLRNGLVDELGVDPSASVRSLEERMLGQDPGLDGPVAPVSPASPDATRSHVSGIVGRAEALATIDTALARLVEHRVGGLLLITGEPGIGKSMLMTETAVRAGRHGARVTIGRCHEADLAPAYWPWLPVVRDLVGDGDAPDDLAALLGADDDGPGDGPGEGPGAAAATTLRTFAAVTRLLEGSSDPVVVLLEDLHWADQTSLRLLTYAAEELRGKPVLLVASVRTVDGHRQPALTHALAGLARLEAFRIPVPPLGTDAVATLLHDVVGQPDPRLVDVLTRRCDGNPFFVLEMARLLVATAGATPEAAERLDVPAGIADVLRLRVLRLPGPARTGLSVASVIGRTFDLRLLTAALGPEALDRLDDAIDAGLVEETEVPGQLRFVHALTRETVYADLPIGRRARWHADIGRALAARLPREPELLGDVAHHHAMAAPYVPDLAGDAVDYTGQAAAAAERSGAFDEAAALWVRTRDLEPGIAERDDARRHRILLALARARERIGDMRGMVAALEEAIELARRSGDHVRMAEAATSHRSSGVWHWREMGEHDPQAIAVLEECVAHVDDVSLTARLLANLALEQYLSRDFEAADRNGRLSLDLARRSEDRTVLRDCLAAREIALFAPGKAAEREACARESLTVADDPEYTMAARFHLATALHHQSRPAEGDEAMAPAYELAARLRHTGLDVPLGWFRWQRAVERDDPEAERIGREMLALHRRTTIVGLPELTGLCAVVSAPVGAPVPPDVIASASGHPFAPFRAAIAHAMCRAGDVTAGRLMLGEQTELGGDYGSLFAGCLTVDILAWSADPGLRAAVEQIRPYADETATYGSVLSLGSTALFIGSGLVALGELDEGRDLIVRALRANTALDCRPWQREARARLDALPA